MVKRSFERCRKAGPFFAGCWLLGSTTALLLCMALRGSDKTQLALTDELQEASEHSFTQADAQGFWACRMSRLDGACGSRSYVEDGQTIVHASCPSNMCCSTTYCARLGQCGRWCSTNWVFCSTAIVYDRTFSYGGNCSCGQQGGKCGGNAHCRDRLSPGGEYSVSARKAIR
ncbi:EGF family domain-containing protein [Besnoitia besnoiti]|uniref:EGF family domain-containing protein n=1 Tax=Besnoitia besnoiti TaxID=94643 RepID=A0A2A9ML81_BESBE|nr:EGF family domain-containing protein [Besnoitia besnoiti]PFH36210.1 EGF family domain-containing protein [Besnoitia besnoiti]